MAFPYTIRMVIKYFQILQFYDITQSRHNTCNMHARNEFVEIKKKNKSFMIMTVDEFLLFTFKTSLTSRAPSIIFTSSLHLPDSVSPWLRSLPCPPWCSPSSPRCSARRREHRTRCPRVSASDWGEVPPPWLFRGSVK